MKLGIGSGSTVVYAVERLVEKVRVYSFKHTLHTRHSQPPNIKLFYN